MHNSQVFPTLQWPGRRARRGIVPSNTCVRVAYVSNCLEYMCTCHLFPLGPIEGLKGHEQLGEAPEGLRPVLPEQKGGCTQCVWGLSEIPFFTIRVWSLLVFVLPVSVCSDSTGMFALALVYSLMRCRVGVVPCIIAHSTFALSPSLNISLWWILITDNIPCAISVREDIQS